MRVKLLLQLQRVSFVAVLSAEAVTGCSRGCRLTVR